MKLFHELVLGDALVQVNGVTEIVLIGKRANRPEQLRR